MIQPAATLAIPILAGPTALILVTATLVVWTPALQVVLTSRMDRVQIDQWMSAPSLAT